MDLSPLTAISPLDGRYADKVEALRPIFSEYGLIRRRLLVEVRWLLALADAGAIGELPKPGDPARARLEAVATTFEVDDAARVKAIEARTNHDVKAVEYYLKEAIAGDSELAPAREFVHFGCTSEDINNLAYGLMLEDARREIVVPTLAQIETRLGELATVHAELAMISRTHGQPASPTTLGKEFANVLARLRRQSGQLRQARLAGKINGAVGNFNAHYAACPNVNWPGLARAFVEDLGLEWNPYTTQIEPHDGIAELCHILVRINTVLLDLARDVWGYISLGYFRQRLIADEVGSSTMPHKINPIDFENAEGNLGLANAMLEHFAAKLPVSRWQRDLSDSTVLRALGTAFAHNHVAYRALLKGLDRIEPDAEAIGADLHQRWEVLAEAVQTVMRRHGLPEPYEQLKRLTRGHAIDRAGLEQFINALEIPEAEKERLLALRPEDYTGNAAAMAKRSQDSC